MMPNQGHQRTCPPHTAHRPSSRCLQHGETLCERFGIGGTHLAGPSLRCKCCSQRCCFLLRTVLVGRGYTTAPLRHTKRAARLSALLDPAGSSPVAELYLPGPHATQAELPSPANGTNRV